MIAIANQIPFDIRNAPFGCACYRGINDNNGVISDFEFVDLNSEFEKITGIGRNQLLSSTVNEIVPNISAESRRWVYCLNQMNYSTEMVKELYSHFTSRWYKINSWAMEQNLIAVIAVEISSPKKSGRYFKYST